MESKRVKSFTDFSTHLGDVTLNNFPCDVPKDHERYAKEE
jgi:hypothetical protein